LSFDEPQLEGVFFNDDDQEGDEILNQLDSFHYLDLR